MKAGSRKRYSVAWKQLLKTPNLVDEMFLLISSVVHCDEVESDTTDR